MSSGFGGKFDKSAVQKVLDFLFGRVDGKDGDSKFLDMRTEIVNREFFNTLTYYRILQEQYACKAAGDIGDILERLAIASGRMSRLEGVTILKQQLPKEEVLMKGISETLKEIKEAE